MQSSDDLRERALAALPADKSGASAKLVAKLIAIRNRGVGPEEHAVAKALRQLVERGDATYHGNPRDKLFRRR